MLWNQGGLDWGEILDLTLVSFICLNKKKPVKQTAFCVDPNPVMGSELKSLGRGVVS